MHTILVVNGTYYFFGRRFQDKIRDHDCVYYWLKQAYQRVYEAYISGVLNDYG